MEVTETLSTGPIFERATGRGTTRIGRGFAVEMDQESIQPVAPLAKGYAS